jgi:hypothetical protein
VLTVGTNNTRVVNNVITQVGGNGVYATSTSGGAPQFWVDGTVISNNIITDIRDDFAQNGEFGNGISAYKAMGVTISGNSIRRTAWSSIRINKANHSTINGNVCQGTARDPGIMCEYGNAYITVVGNTVTDTWTSGIAFTNLEDGAFGMTCVGNVIKNFGMSGANTHSGVIMAHGLVASNEIDGAGNPVAIWGVRIGTPGGIATYEYRVQVHGNRISGTKYAVAAGASSTSGTKESWITDNTVVRTDANWVGPIGTLGGSNTDGGDGSTIGAASALTMYLADNNFDIPTPQTPQPFMAASRVKINGVWNRSDGTRWIPDVAAPTVPVAATDPATTMALVNALRTALIANGAVK